MPEKKYDMVLRSKPSDLTKEELALFMGLFGQMVTAAGTFGIDPTGVEIQLHFRGTLHVAAARCFEDFSPPPCPECGESSVHLH